MSPPLVSCIMPTRDRPAFVAQALRYFLRQDYPERELVVVDDGSRAVAELLPDDDRFHYVRLDRRTSLGRKRNLACKVARGELIAHWDDDDWMSSRRLSLQVEALLAAGADACGAEELLHYGIEAGEAWLHRAPRNGRPVLALGTLLLRRDAWSAAPYAEVDVGECQPLLTAARLVALADSSFYVALDHRGALSARPSDGRRPRPVRDVAARMGDDCGFYLGLRNGRTERARRPWRQVLTVAAPLMLYDGYGSMAEYLVRGMAREGADVNLIPLQLDRDGLAPEVLELLDASSADARGAALYYCWPRSDLDRLRGADELFIKTAWESDRLPSGWAAHLNRARAAIVPSRFVADACRASGVTVPLEVVPDGIDPEIHHFEERGERDGLTTLMVGPVVERKNVTVGVAAWKRAFAHDPSARLIVKARFGHGRLDAGDARIEVVDSNEATRGIAHWYRRADVLMALGNEGFGLPLIEGMATGLPVIALDSEGQGDTCHAAGDLVLPVKPVEWRPYEAFGFGPCGRRGVPAVEDVAAQLRWVDRHREEARALGQAASEWVPRHRNVWDKGPAVLDVMEQQLGPRRPLRRPWTFWSPAGELDAYLGALAAHCNARVVRHPCELRPRLLHLLHTGAAVDDADIAEVLGGGVPVVVTELEPGFAFAYAAEALVATTEAAAAQLRRRWPDKRVEHIPLGGPAWSAARKRGRGRVVATPQLGAAAVAEAARAARAELLVVERLDERLAAEADAVVVWHEDTSASLDVRYALATGVPVLTRRAAWSADVRAATHQPADLVAGLERVLDDDTLARRLAGHARELCEHTSWAAVARRHLNLWTELEAS